MEHRVLGGTGVRVSAYCLGAMMFGSWGNPDRDEGVRIIRSALDGGIDFVDTADVYSEGENEEIVGRALKGRRDDVVLASKCHMPMGPGPNERGSSRLWIMRAVEASLRRLGTDHIDLYQVHRPDPDTDVEDTLAALDDLVGAGKIRYAGSSTFPAWQIVEAQWASERRNLVRFRCEQPPYSILVRGIERDVLPVARRYGMGVIVWSPLAQGWLTGKYRRGEKPPPDSRAARAAERGEWLTRRFDPSLPVNQRKMDIVDRLSAVADKAGVSLTHLAIAFSLAHPAVTSTIVGPRTQEQLDDLLAGADVRLDDDTLDAIDEIVAPGEVVDPTMTGYQPPWMEAAARRS
ncbi:MAG TPA: aldo/keto reductase [Actinomycetota bacterium]|nr:aldo/keto reductase [Actinomycetota bacterium]